MSIDTTELSLLIRDWWSRNYASGPPTFVGITLSTVDVETYTYQGELMSIIFDRLYMKQSPGKSTVTRIHDVAVEEFRKNGIGYNSATLIDFITLFPNQASFLKKRNIGKRSVTLMEQVMKKAGVPWPTN